MIAEYWGIAEHKNKPIIYYEERKQHVIDKHLKDFGSVEAIDKIINHFPNIISKPNYVFYNSESKGLEYYKKVDSTVCVAVRVNFGKTLKIKSWYPTNENKLLNRKKKELEMKADQKE